MFVPEQPLLRGCRDLDQHVRGRLLGISNRAQDRFGGQLIAVLLGGSLARGQGISVRRRSGPTALLSDIDAYVVVTPAVPVDERDDFLASATAVLKEDPLLIAPPDLAVVDPAYFIRGGQELVRAQLRHGSRFLWPPERDRVSGLRRQWNLLEENVPEPSVEDAQRLVLNRCTEWWLVDGGDPLLAAAHRLKQWIDAPLSWLASAGGYHPSRKVQVQRLMELGTQLPADVRSEWVEGLEFAATWVQRSRESTIEESELLEWARIDSMKDVSGDGVRNWVWPFVRCAWQGSTGGSVQALGKALVQGPPCDEDRILASRWLRRRTLFTRWREARRWSRLSPRPLRPWWQYGHEGSGIERLWVACTLAYAGIDGGAATLDGLVASRVIDDPHDWARWWAEWFLGKGRR